MSIYSERLDFYGRLLVREIIENIAKFGLEKEIYICCDPNCSGVVIPESMLKSHTNNVLIVLQPDRYLNLRLDIENKGFFVDLLNEGSDIDKIYITYASLVSFTDPNEDFSLEFIPQTSCDPKQAEICDNILLFPARG